MNPYCRACKHEVTGHTNRICGKLNCHCGCLLIDNEEVDYRTSRHDSEYSPWKNNKSKFNPEEKKFDRTNKKVSY